MKALVNAVLTAAMVMLLGAGVVACEMLQKDVAPKIATVVTQYCREAPEARLALRTQVNASIAPNHIELTCAADSPPR